MKKLLILGLVALVMLSCSTSHENEKEENNIEDEVAFADSEIENNDQENTMNTSDFYSFKMQTLDGADFDFASLKGKRVLVVNTASECGYTPQYEGLQKLYDTYKNNGFVIVGFPANNFGGQEPGSDKEIAGFCQKNFGVTFPMMSKSSVKGEDINEVYNWLTSKSLNGKEDVEVKWNFNKFLIDEEGKWVAYYPSDVKPSDERIVTFAKG